MIERTISTTVGDIVARDFRTAGVFEQFGIDFCCGGRRSLADACRTATVDPAALLHALDAVTAIEDRREDVTGWPAGRLVEHIVETHHSYVRTAMP
jgi:regulator of cell morphogenesis and NO signaling